MKKQLFLSIVLLVIAGSAVGMVSSDVKPITSHEMALTPMMAPFIGLTVFNHTDQPIKLAHVKVYINGEGGILQYKKQVRPGQSVSFSLIEARRYVGTTRKERKANKKLFKSNPELADKTMRNIVARTIDIETSCINKIKVILEDGTKIQQRFANGDKKGIQAAEFIIKKANDNSLYMIEVGHCRF